MHSTARVGSNRTLEDLPGPDDSLEETSLITSHGGGGGGAQGYTDHDRRWTTNKLSTMDQSMSLGDRLGRQNAGHMVYDCVRLRKTRIPALTWLLLLSILSLATTSQAAFVNFQNCLSQQIISGTPPPLRLQFDPLNATVNFDLNDPAHNLTLTIYGNVSGQTTIQSLPPSSDQKYWSDPLQTNGKVINIDNATGIYSTLFPSFSVLNYDTFSGLAESFCGSLTGNYTCPLGPVFDNVQTTLDLPAITSTHPMESTYGFTTISAIFRAEQGDLLKTPLACIQIDITPYIGVTAESLVTYLPLLVLVLMAVATTCAALFSPWGTWDIFRATSNYGREVRLLRLMTPGFGDCLNYLQFIVLTGSLSLSYPGFFQPVVSNLAWSVLMFNQSFVTHGPGSPLVVDGIYVANGTYGLDVMSQLTGMTSEQDLWAGVMIWLLVVIGAILLLIQAAFATRWLYRLISRTQEEDLRAKNLPFSAGNAIRIIFNYFLLPIITVCMFQLVIAASSTTLATPIMAALTILILLVFAAWLIWVIINARPRSFLFDDLPSVLLYGPLYNTYSDNAAPFALVTIIIAFLRGIAIGAVQPSGLAQIIMLAICEIIFMLTLNAFRPFFSGTYMNLINTLFSITRLVTVVLMVTFVPTLGIDDIAKGYVGYIILLLHALVLFVGFFVRVISTILELVARAAGAGSDDSSAFGGFARVLGLRQLARRNVRDASRSRASYASNATMLAHAHNDRVQSAQRSRSMSASSGLLLNHGPGNRQSVALESVSGVGGYSHAGSGIGHGNTPSTAGGPGSSVSHAMTGGSGQGTLTNLRGEPADPYFRPPRPRRVTLEMQSPEEAPSQGSWGSGDWSKPGIATGAGAAAAAAAAAAEAAEGGDLGEGPSISGRGTPLGGVARADRTDSFDERTPKPDYATREVDYYYGVRGPALSHMPTRRLKTGPADPTGPVSSATGWFRGLFGGKTKDKGKGFEVVRSSRMPPMEMEEKDLADGDHTPAPYTDDPEYAAAAAGPATATPRRNFQLDDERDAVGAGTIHPAGDNGATRSSTAGRGAAGAGTDFLGLPEIDAGESIHLPSRFNSTATTYHQRAAAAAAVAADEPLPDLPRRSSKRSSNLGSSQPGSTDDVARLNLVPASGPDSSAAQRSGRDTSSSVRDSLAAPPSVRDSGSSSVNWPLPGRSTPQRMPFGSTLNPNYDARHIRTFSAGSEVSAVSDVSRTSDVSVLSNAGDGRGIRDSGRGVGMRDSGRVSPAVSALSSQPYANDRPESMGFVQQHRAQDGIHVVQPDERALAGSRAEFVSDEARSP